MDIEQSEGRIASQIFSTCIAPNGGELTFGDWNEFLHVPNSNKQMIDCSQNDWNTQYHVKLTSIKVG